MKKTLLFIASAFLIALNANSQTYGYATTSATYTNLVNPTSVNNGMTWDDPDTSISTGFTYQLFGNNYDSLYFGFGLGSYLTPLRNPFAQIIPIIGLSSADIIDRGAFSTSQTSLSPISTKVEGASGNRIFKLEFRNAGFYGDLDDDGISTDFINMQLWIYENSGDIEYHFGPSNVSQPLLAYDTVGAVHSLIPNVDIFNGQVSPNSILLEGPANNPIAYKDSSFRVVTGTPASGTVYRFINGGSVSLKELVKNADQLTFEVFPNPAVDFISLNLELTDLISNVVSIYNMKGQLVSIKGFEKRINLSDLNQGTYFIEAITNEGRAIAKFVKN
tara:strand:- start:6194 stop:7189 length:996 start_codon:yes stop_codon:yes gene_type:complete